MKWDEIEWINHHMHRHLLPYPWTIYQAIESLKSFVDPKEPFLAESRTVYSFYSATYVENEEVLHKEIESSLKNEYPAMEIAWLATTEIWKPLVKRDQFGLRYNK